MESSPCSLASKNMPPCCSNFTWCTSLLKKHQHITIFFILLVSKVSFKLLIWFRSIFFSIFLTHVLHLTNRSWLSHFILLFSIFTLPLLQFSLEHCSIWASHRLVSVPVSATLTVMPELGSWKPLLGVVREWWMGKPIDTWTGISKLESLGVGYCSNLKAWCVYYVQHSGGVH